MFQEGFEKFTVSAFFPRKLSFLYQSENYLYGLCASIGPCDSALAGLESNHLSHLLGGRWGVCREDKCSFWIFMDGLLSGLTVQAPPLTDLRLLLTDVCPRREMR